MEFIVNCFEADEVHQAGEFERHRVEDRPKQMVSVVCHERTQSHSAHTLLSECRGRERKGVQEKPNKKCQ